MTFQIGDIVTDKRNGIHYTVIGKQYHRILCRNIKHPNIEWPIGRHYLDLVPNQELLPSELVKYIALKENKVLSRYEAKNMIDEIYDNLAKTSIS